MMESSQRPAIPSWLYKLFTGHQYPYVRRLAKFSKPRQEGIERTDPTSDEIDAKFWEVFPRCRVKALQEVKAGMIVSFIELGNFEPGGYQELIDSPEDFLFRTFGKKKIKINFYDDENFVCTINFKVGGWTSHDDDAEEH